MCINSISISNFLQILKNCVDKWSCNSFSFPNRTSIERENKSDSTCGKSHSIRIYIVGIWIVKIRKVYCLINSVSVYTIKSICYLRLDWNLRCLKHTFQKPSIWFFQFFFVVVQLQIFAIYIIIYNVLNSMKWLLWSSREIAFEINQMMCRSIFIMPNALQL